jgi:hypothetical protein
MSVDPSKSGGETQDKRAGSRFRAFWSSLPGVLTGIAAVLAAAGTLIAIFRGDDSEPSRPAAVAFETSGPAAAGDGGCFGEYLEGIPAGRVAELEAGGYEDVISETEPKAGPIGIAFTDFGEPVGGIRFEFFPASGVYRIESVVDAACEPVGDYEVQNSGDKTVWPDSASVRVRYGDQFYDVTANGGGSIVRIKLSRVTP